MATGASQVETSDDLGTAPCKPLDWKRSNQVKFPAIMFLRISVYFMRNVQPDLVLTRHIITKHVAISPESWNMPFLLGKLA